MVAASLSSALAARLPAPVKLRPQPSVQLHLLVQALSQRIRSRQQPAALALAVVEAARGALGARLWSRPICSLRRRLLLLPLLRPAIRAAPACAAVNAPACPRPRTLAARLRRARATAAGEASERPGSASATARRRARVTAGRPGTSSASSTACRPSSSKSVAERAGALPGLTSAALSTTRAGWAAATLVASLLRNREALLPATAATMPSGA